MQNLLKDIRACEVCKAHLPLGPRPIVAANPYSKIVIIGQVLGTKVHKTGVPWFEEMVVPELQERVVKILIV